MAQKISGNIKGLSGVRCDLVKQDTDTRIDVVNSKFGGIWEFDKPTPGIYDIRFFGRDVSEADWLIGYEVYQGDPYLGGDVTYAFWNGVAPYDDSKIVKENEFGWFNQSQLKFHIKGGGNNPNIDVEAIFYRIFYNGSWTSWTPDLASGITHEVDIDIAGIANIAGENNIIEFYVTFVDGTQDMVTTVPFKYDNTAPIFNITAGIPVGGFGRIGLDWTNVDVSDALSGIGYILIYRDTNDSFSGAVEVGKITIVDQSIIPSSFIDDTMPSNDQATKYFYWGKAQDRSGNLSTEARLDVAALGTNIVLLLPGDVDGALRIQNNPSGVNWEVIYGIRVPIQAVIITAGILANVTAITAIQYKDDDDDTWHDITTPQYNGGTISYPYSIAGMSEGETLTFTYPTVYQNKKYHRVIFDHADAETEIALCHFESILAADIIIGGVLRLEKGLSIWTGSFDANGDVTGSGMFIDKLGQQLWDAAGNVNQRLNNDGSATFGKTGVAQITIATNGVVSIDSALLVITSATTFETGYDPTIKRQHFSVTPAPPYWVDDLWTDGTNLKRCTTQKIPPQTYNITDWENATEYGDKSTRWVQPSTNDPSSGWTAQEKLDHEGDQWVKTDQGYKLFSWTGAVWIQDYTEINGGHIDTYSIDADKLSIGAVSWTTDIIFEPDGSGGADYESRYIKWNSGSIKFSNGETKTSIPLGSTKLVSDPRSWVYHNEATNTILLTAAYSDAVGIGKTLMAIVDRTVWGEGSCVISPINNTGTTIDADGIKTGRVSSLDGYTYFDLINNLIKLYKTTTRILIGDLGSTYGIKLYDGANHLLLHIDETTQIIQTADGNTYIDLGNNQIVMVGGSITAATFKTSAAAVDRVEIDSTAGVKIFRVSGGGAGAKPYKLNFYDGSTWRAGITALAASGIHFENDTGNPFIFYAENVQINEGLSVGNDIAIAGSVDNVKISEIFSIPKNGSVTVVTNNLQNTASQSRVVITGADAIINRIYKGEDGQILILEASSVGYTYTLQHGVASSGDYHGILTIDGTNHNVGDTDGRKMRMLMYSGQRGKWMLLNAD